jgi:hypothetical protein
MDFQVERRIVIPPTAQRFSAIEDDPTTLTESETSVFSLVFAHYI